MSGVAVRLPGKRRLSRNICIQSGFFIIFCLLCSGHNHFRRMSTVICSWSAVTYWRSDFISRSYAGGANSVMPWLHLSSPTTFLRMINSSGFLQINVDGSDKRLNLTLKTERFVEVYSDRLMQYSMNNQNVTLTDNIL